MEEIIVEASRSRFWNHLSGSGSLAIVSASTQAMKEMKPPECRREEHRASALLQNAIIALGYGDIPLYGGYTYEPTDTPAALDTGSSDGSSEFDVEAALASASAKLAPKTVTEPSFAIPDITLEQTLKLGSDFGQAEVFYKAKDFTAGYYNCVTKKMTTAFDFSPYLPNDQKSDRSRRNMTFDPEKIKKGFSQLRRGTHVGRVKFGFPLKESGAGCWQVRLYEVRIPTRGEAITGTLAGWVRIL